MPDSDPQDANQSAPLTAPTADPVVPPRVASSTPPPLPLTETAVPSMDYSTTPSPPVTEPAATSADTSSAPPPPPPPAAAEPPPTSEATGTPPPPEEKKDRKKLWLIAATLFIAVTIPLAVYLAQQSQELRQRAQQVFSSPTPTPAPGITPPSCPSDTQLLFANTDSLNIGTTLTAGGTISSMQGSWSVGTRDGVLVAGGGQKMGVTFAYTVLLDTVLMFDHDPKSGESLWSINGVSLPVTGGGKWGSYTLDLPATQMNFDNGGDSPHFNVCVKESQPSPTPIPLPSPTPPPSPDLTASPVPTPYVTPNPTPATSPGIGGPAPSPRATPSPVPSLAPSIPVAGTSWPTIFLVIGGFALLVLGLALP